MNVFLAALYIFVGINFGILTHVSVLIEEDARSVSRVEHICGVAFAAILWLPYLVSVTAVSLIELAKKKRC